MKRTLLFCAFALLSFTSAYAQSTGWDGVEKVFGRKGAVQGDMYKITFPRSDLKVLIGEVPVEPGLALTSWIGFAKMGKQAMMMGDLVLLENEVAPVIAKLVAEGVDVTALHNHLIGTSPAVLYLHFSGRGKPEKLAGAMRAALASSATPLEPPAAQEAAAPPDWSKVEAILGKKGQKKGNLLQFGFPRKETIKEEGMIVPPYLGMANSVNLQKVGDKAATTGDFVLIGSEVNPVIKALVSHGIAVTAVHSHMLFESPRLFFLHFWGYDEPEKLAAGLKSALGKVNLAK
ncbi:MAG TPA: DUF1259 domain-containing protein [Geobacteraceae bacterium]